LCNQKSENARMRSVFKDFFFSCLVSGVWCLVFGVWCLVSGVWCLVSGVWCLVSGVWCLVSGIWCKDRQGRIYLRAQGL